MTQAPRVYPAPFRCVVVGSSTLAESLRSHGGERGVAIEAVDVDSFLAALGEMAHGRFDLVVGPLDRAADMVEATAAAVRRLAPEATLIATARLDASPELARRVDAARRAGFDAVVDTALDGEGLLEMVRHGAGNGAAQAAAARSEAGGGSSHEGQGTRTEDGASERNSPTPSASPASSGATPPRTPSPLPPHASAAATRVPTPPAADALGDTDLIESLLTHGQAAMHGEALRLVAAQSGIVGLDFLAGADADRRVPAPHAAAPVRYLEHRFGALHAPPPATAAELDAWAGWLARWLALGQRFDEVNHLCLRDELTGVWNRRHFNRFFDDVLERAAADRRPVTLLVFDIDDFKAYNDRFGHPAGDEILRETARLMQDSIREHDVVARIGGDEFAVIFWDHEDTPRQPNSQHPGDVLKAARRFQQAVYAHRFPKLADHAPGPLTVSGGLATYPWDGHTAEELLEHADAMALESKRQGKNAITFGPTALGGQGG